MSDLSGIGLLTSFGAGIPPGDGIAARNRPFHQEARLMTASLNP
jgi:hypothetical protein